MRTDASIASLLLTVEGVLTAVLAWVVFKENADRRVVLGMLAIAVGGALLTWEPSRGMLSTGLQGRRAVVRRGRGVALLMRQLQLDHVVAVAQLVQDR